MSVKPIPTNLLDRVTCGDSFELGKLVPDNSVHLIICDPVWQEMGQYIWLAKFAQRVLVPGGNLIAQTCSEYLFQAQRFMHKGTSLTPMPLICETLVCLRTFWKYRVSQAWKPYIWFSKTDAKHPGQRLGDQVQDAFKAGPRNKKKHPWQDALAFFIHYIAKLTGPGDVVCDPFAGSGTVGKSARMLQRHHISFEISPELAEQTGKDILDTMIMFDPLAALKPATLSTRAKEAKQLDMLLT